MIQVINKLYLHHKSGCSVFNRTYNSAHLRQGVLDGACAVYSLMMYLLILNVVSRRQLEDLYGTVKKKDAINNLFKSLFENRGLIRDGFSYTNLQPIINRYLGDVLKAKAHTFEDEDELLKTIKNCIDRNNPIMISVEFTGGAHAMLAVGYEADENGIFNVFCLDPGFDCPLTSYWNAVVALQQGSAGKYSHKYITNDSYYCNNVRLDEILIIELNK